MKLTPKQDRWLTLAVSTDETRINLTKIYRDKNHFVSCNGHVLHAIKVPIKSKPHFPCGLNASFPEWSKYIINKSPKIYYNYPPSMIRELKKTVQTLAKFLHNTGCDSKNQIIKLTLFDNGIVCHAVDSWDNQEGIVKIGNTNRGDSNLIALSPKYLMQALYDAPDQFNTTLSYVDELSLLIVTSKLDGLETIAAISPMRIK